MALRQTKKISELPALTPATLDTTFVVGISGSTTYKISINQLTSSLDSAFATDLVTTALSGTLDGKLSTSSFNSYTASISTASLVNRLNAIESVSGSWITESETGSFLTSLSGAISSSTQISDLGFVTGSYTTINSFNNLTQSFNSISQSFNVISGSVGGIDFSTLATTGSNVFKGQQIISGALTVSISGNAFGVNENPTTNNIFWSYIPNDTNTTSIEPGWIVNIETVGTYTVTNVEYDYPFVKITLDDGLLELPYRCNGYFSLVSKELKFGTDGVLKISGSLSVSGSITGSTDFNTIVNKPTLISGSSQLTSSLDTRYAASGSAPTLFLLEAYANVTYTLPGGFTDDTCRYSIVNNTVNVPSNWFNTSTYRFTPQKAGYWQIIASYDIYRNSEASMAIRKNGGVVAAAGTFDSVAQQVTKIVYLNGSTDYIDVMNTGGASNSRAQFDSRSWFQAKWIGQ